MAINKIHPTQHTLHEPYRAYKTLGEIATKLETEYGLQQTNHIPRKVISENLADDMEHHSGIESLLGWIKRQCQTELENAKSWQELHQTLADHGLHIRERGNGFIIADTNGLSVKASSVCRSLSKNKLEQRFGVFEPTSKEDSTSHKQHYQQLPVNHRVDTTELYAKFQAEQQNNKTSVTNALTQAKANKCRLIKQVKRHARLKRSAIKLMKIHRVNKKVLYSMVSKTLQSDIKKIKNQYDHKRHTIFDKHQLKTWADWLQKQALLGNQEALSA